ncbi:hypothetical protein F5Y16DRAFT_420250 [Xylariaceae sp. FL0255]|nr:hypothetical protein F5Y16DRAFT_420250 [Xylariaceae sp. FL0255]
MASLRKSLSADSPEDHEKAIPSAHNPISKKAPVSLVTGHPPLNSFPIEILQATLRLLGPEDLQTLSKLNIDLYWNAIYVLYEELELDLQDMSSTSQALKQLEFLERHGLLRAVRVLKVWNPSHEIEDEEKEASSDPTILDLRKDVLHQLDQIIQRMEGLNDFHWETDSIRSTLIHSLPNKTRLHLTCRVAKSNRLLCESFRQLEKNQNLVSISLQAYCPRPEIIELMNLLWELLFSCPNLTRLPSLEFRSTSEVQQDEYSSDSSDEDDSDNDYDEDSSTTGDSESSDVNHTHAGGDSLPNVNTSTPGAEDLSPIIATEVAGSGGPDPNNNRGYAVLEELGFYSLPLMGDYRGPEHVAIKLFQRKWLNTVDWSQLVRLNPICPGIALRIAPMLSNVKEVIITGYLTKSGVEDFLEAIPNGTIESLTLMGGWRDLDKELVEIITNRYGSSLRKLFITPCGGGPCRRRDLDYSAQMVQALSLFSQGLPFLEELGIDKHIVKNTLLFDKLDLVATMSSLRTVKIWGFCEHQGSEHVLNAFSARSLFAYLRARNRTIANLVVESTECCPKCAWRSEYYQPMRYECGISLSRGDETRGFIELSCSLLSTAQNKELSVILKGTEDVSEVPKFLEANNIETAELDIALYGNPEIQRKGPHACTKY